MKQKACDLRVDLLLVDTGMSKFALLPMLLAGSKFC